MPKVSIVIPVFNERGNIGPLVNQIESALAASGLGYELILVDDGSVDGTDGLIKDLSLDREWLRCVFLIRNYGQSTALQAGFDAALGSYIVTLDGDLQNDPSDIPSLIQILDEDASVDCVSGWRRSRQDASISRKLPSLIANALISRVTKVRLHDYGCALKAYRAEIIHNLRLYGELHRFIPALASEVGARIKEIPVNHRARAAGVSKYGIDRTFRVLLDLLWIKFTMRFLHRPIHAFGGLAIPVLIGGLGILFWLAIEKLFLGADIGGRPLLILGVLLTLVGIQLLATGLIGELLVRIYHEPSGRAQYITRHVREPK
jgi:glycosyltransferase involved in cell wall biosynthesis